MTPDDLKARFAAEMAKGKQPPFCTEWADIGNGYERRVSMKNNTIKEETRLKKAPKGGGKRG